MEWSKYNFLIKCDEIFYLYNSMSNIIYHLDKKEFDLFTRIAEGNDSLDQIDKESYNSLIDDHIITTANKFDYLRFKLIIQSSRFDNSTLTLGISLINSYLKREDRKNMSDKRHFSFSKEFEFDLISFIKLHKVEHVNITWIINDLAKTYAVIKRVSNRIKRLDLNLNTDLIIINDKLTKTFQFEELNVKKMCLIIDPTQYSMDLIEYIPTDCFSFLKNLFKVENIHLSVCIKMNKSNIDFCAKLYHIFKTYFANSRYVLYASFNDAWGNCKNLSKESKQEYLKLNIEAIQKYDIKTEISYLLTKNSSECIAKHINGFLIDCKGYIYKCWLDLDNEDKAIAHLNNKIISNHTLHLQYLSDGDPFDDIKCQKCAYLPKCKGGCPRIKSEANNKYYACSSMKDNLSKIIGINIQNS